MEDGPRPGQQVIEVILPTYAMGPEQSEKFYPSLVRAACNSVLTRELASRDYDEDCVKDWIRSIGDSIKNDVKLMNLVRYKVIVQVTIGQLKNQGVSIASRCLWDVAHDNYASVSFTNASLWANVMVFGVYTD